MTPATIRVRRLGRIPLPTRATAGAAGFDIRASETTIIPAGGFALVGTGLAIEMPADMEAQVRPRSGLAARSGIGVLNSPGTIDSDYRGEIRIVLFNISARDFTVRRGDRIAQLVFSRIVGVRFVTARRPSRTRRSTGGFGHTG